LPAAFLPGRPGFAPQQKAGGTIASPAPCGGGESSEAVTAPRFNRSFFELCVGNAPADDSDTSGNVLTGQLMTLPPLTCPALTGGAFPGHSYDVAHNHRDAARTSPQRKTALGARNTCCRGAAWPHWGDIARPRVQRRYVSRLVHDGLATAHRQTMRVRRRKTQVARVMITDAGRRALES